MGLITETKLRLDIRKVRAGCESRFDDLSIELE